MQILQWKKELLYVCYQNKLCYVTIGFGKSVIDRVGI